MATKYDRVNPWEEKLKRLMNCSRLVETDQRYLNYQFEKYKLCNYHITCAAFASLFMFGSLPVVKQATPFKYYSSVAGVGLGVYYVYIKLNNSHFEQIYTPYFEKYRVK